MATQIAALAGEIDRAPGICADASDQASIQSNDDALHEAECLQIVTDAALRHLSVEELLPSVLAPLRGTFGVELFVLLRQGAAGRSLRVEAAPGPLKHVPARVLTRLANQLTAVAEPLVLEGPTAVGMAYPALVVVGVHSLAVLPLVIDDGQVGTMLLAAPRARCLARHHVRLLCQVAHRIALAVERAERYEAVRKAAYDRDDLLTAVAHDMKNPLTSIRLRSELLRREAECGTLDVGHLLDALARSEATSRRAARLCDELLDAARFGLGEPTGLYREQVDLVVLARTLVAEHQCITRRHRLIFEAATPAVVGNWDTSRIERVLSNLLYNAIRYSPDGGEITVRVGREFAGAGAWGLLSVYDHGVGIPPGDLPYIFDRFYRGRNAIGRTPGNGFGLAISRDLVEQHGGTIEVESVPTLGTTFTIRLPIESAVTTCDPAANGAHPRAKLRRRQAGESARDR